MWLILTFCINPISISGELGESAREVVGRGVRGRAEALGSENGVQPTDDGPRRRSADEDRADDVRRSQEETRSTHSPGTGRVALLFNFHTK